MSKTELKSALASLLSGILFGLGLAIAGMTNPAKVLAFLDITGHWDASLLLVLGSAVTLAAAGFYLARRHGHPWYDTGFHLPERTRPDLPLVLGSILFGIGWGISGYCPGPALTLLVNPSMETLAFLPAMLAGWGLHAFIYRP